MGVARPMLAAFSRYRPRVLTLVVFFVVAAVLVLANLSTEISGVEDRNLPLSPYLVKLSGGWPLTWHRYIILSSPGPAGTIGWQYSARRLAANLAISLVMVAAPVSACEWLLRRHRPRLRWSLWTMLVAVALIAAFCGWFAAARRRASLQDPIIGATKSSDSRVVLERWGPQWLRFLGADPYRRYIVGANFYKGYSSGGLADEEVEVHLRRLSQLPALRYLVLEVDRLTPAMTSVLKDMRQLRVLSVAQREGWTDDPHPDRISHQCLAVIGGLTQLEGLRLGNMVIASESLESLKNLTRLRSLSFDSCFNGDNWDDEDVVDYPPTFGKLSLLPQLEELELAVYDVDDRDLRRIASLPRLKSLDLHVMWPVITSNGLAELGALKSLEELAIHDDLNDGVVSAAGVESLIKVEHLKLLHLIRSAPGSAIMLPLDNGDEIAVPASEADAFLRALKALRKAKPGIVIDNRDYWEDWSAEREIPWDAESNSDYFRNLPQLPPGAFPQIIPAEGIDGFKSLSW